MSNYTHYEVCVLPNFKLKFVDGYVISSHTLLGVWLLIHASKGGPKY